MLSEFVSSEVEFLLVGAYALAAHGYPRATGDIDLWVRADVATAIKVFDAIARFGAPLHDLTPEDFSRPGIVFQIGVAPIRIDILTSVDGIEFGEAWKNRITTEWDGLAIPVIGVRDLILNKRSTGRTSPWR